MLSGVGKVLAALENRDAKSNPADWVVLDAPLEDAGGMPWELRYLLSLRPSRKKEINDLLESGHALGFGMDRQVPKNVGAAVSHVSDLTQEGLANFWVERLLRYGQHPVWTEAEEREAKNQGVDLKREVSTVREYANRHSRFALVNSKGGRVDEVHLESLRTLNDDLGQVAVPNALLALRRHDEKRQNGFAPILAASSLILILAAILLYRVWPFGGLLLIGISPSLVLGMKQIYKASIRTYFGRAVNKNLGIQFLVLILSAILVGLGLWFSVPFAFWIGAVLGPVHDIVRRFAKVFTSLRRLGETNKLPVWQTSLGHDLLIAERGPIVRAAGLVLGFVIMAFIFRTPSLLADPRLAAFAVWLPMIGGWAAFRTDLEIGRWLYSRGLKKLWRQAIVLTDTGW